MQTEQGPRDEVDTGLCDGYCEGSWRRSCSLRIDVGRGPEIPNQAVVIALKSEATYRRNEVDC